MSTQSLFPRILAAHHRIEQLVTRLEIESDLDEVRRVVRELLLLLAPHMVAEEEVVFPNIQRRIAGEEERVMLLQATLDHEEIWELAMRFEEPSATPDEVKATARALNKILTSHIEEEEQDILFLARKVLTYHEFAQVAREVQDRQEELIEVARKRAEGEPEHPIGDLYREIGDQDRRARYVHRPR